MSTQLNHDEEYCPVARSVSVVGDRWALLIVRDAFDGVRRFGDFQRNLSVSKNILADRLRKLVDAGILQTQAASDGTSYQEYVLTEAGLSLFPLLVALRQWGEAHLFKRGERHSVLIDAETGKRVTYMAPLSADGSYLHPARTLVRKVK
ncbi:MULTISPECIES: winged helix-turn-helix transcriptional regulator [Herbaspirillum]|uniref:Helix-turn-helix domain-containing protein n=1 Tax=Herbaspirillum huttiense subsp. lycopersici TaxID=3074428 RepID=A0ABU2ELP7_9BURK|nr:MULTISPECIES: helix-turn-helix domain-containing protein [Herbaspirillum]MDR6741338.1 DNA-binding HxlR family transcriptional regulator [Herbaspirillum sp. 1173]MDR9849049.1 helix-turn-helix domain-containing protein [Herbaspirillum huttiense SE1]